MKRTKPPSSTSREIRTLASKLRDPKMLASVLTARAQLADRAGLSFGNRRDMNRALGYPRDEALTYDRFVREHRRDGLARRIVRLGPQATWSGGVEVLETSDPDQVTTFEAAFAQLARRTRLFRFLRRVDELAGLGRYAVLLLVTAEQDLRKPLERLEAKSLAGFSVFSEGSAPIARFDSTAGSPRWGHPEFYELTLSDQIQTGAGANLQKTTQQVHHSRIIHVAQDLLEDDIFGTPVLMAVFNRLVDMQKVVGGSAESFWKTADRGILWNFDPKATVTDDDFVDMADQLDEWEHDLRRNMLGRGVEANVLGSETADPRGPFEVIASIISGTLGYPKRILFGSERGQLASLEDRANFAGVIGERRENYAEPDLLRALVDRLVALGTLPSPRDPDDYQVKWSPVLVLTEEEKAKRAQTVATAIKAMADRGQMTGRVVITDAEFREIYLDLDPKLPEERAMPAVPKPVEPTPAKRKAKPNGDGRDVPDPVVGRGAVIGHAEPEPDDPESIVRIRVKE